MQLIEAARQKIKKTTDAINGDDRSKKAAYTSIANVASQLVQTLTSLVSVPLTLSYLDSDRFALWVVVMALVSFLFFADLGVGIGMQDRLTKAISRQDRDEIGKIFQLSLTFVLLVACLMAVICYAVVPLVSWNEFFNLKTESAKREINSCIRAFVIATSFGMVAAIVQRVFLAFQEGYIAAILMVASKIIGLVGLLIVVALKGELWALVGGMVGVGNVFLIVAGLYLLRIQKKWIFKKANVRIGAYEFQLLLAILKIGILGLGASLAFLIANSSAPFVLTKKYGAESIVIYSLFIKLTALPTTLLTQALNPLWPALTDAAARGDWRWIRSRYRKSVLFTLLVAFFSAFVLGCFGETIIRHWTGRQDFQVDIYLIGPVLFMMFVGHWNIVLSVFLNGLSSFKSQATWGLWLSIAAFAFALWLPAAEKFYFELWVIALGVFLRCLVMSFEIKSKLKLIE